MNHGLQVDACVPLMGRALIRPLRMPEMTRGGILVASLRPDSNAVDRPDASFFTAIGEVVNAGLARMSETGTSMGVPAVKGERVLHFTERSIEIEIDGVPHLIVAHPGIIARVEYTEPPEEPKVKLEHFPAQRDEPILTPMDT